MSDGLANKDRKKYCAWQATSIKGQSFLTNLRSHRSDKKGKRQEEKSRGRETWRLASAVTVSTLLAVFRSSDIQSAEKQITRDGRQNSFAAVGHSQPPVSRSSSPLGSGAGNSTLGRV